MIFSIRERSNVRPHRARNSFENISHIVNQTNCLYFCANEAPTMNNVVDVEIFDKWLLPENVVSQKQMVSLCIPKTKTGEPIHLDLVVSDSAMKHYALWSHHRIVVIWTCLKM